MAKVDMDSARSTYALFIGLIKWSVPIVAIITLIVVLLIAE